MKSKDEMHLDEVQNLLKEYESFQKIIDQFYFGNADNEKAPTRKYTFPEEPSKNTASK